MQAAAQLIVTEGLSASNMENVRRAASVSGSQLAHYFADKGALIRAVIRHQIGVVLDFHRQPTLRGLSSFDDFEKWIDLNMRYLRRIGYVGTLPITRWPGCSRSRTVPRATSWRSATASGSSCWRRQFSI